MEDPSTIPLLSSNSASTVPLVILLVILIVLSAFFSGVETAFTGLNNVRLKKLAETKKSAKKVLSLTDKFDKVISSILIGNNIVNITATTISTVICTNIWGPSLGPIITTVGLTVIILILGEITPKMLAREYGERFLSSVIYFYLFFYYLFLPVTLFFDAWKLLLNKVFRLGKKAPSLTEDEFKLIVTDIKDEGVLNQHEHDLIQNSIIFDDTLVSSIMTPKAQVVKITRDMTNVEIKNLFEENNYSRVPFLSEEGEVIGVIHQKDFYEMLLEQNCEIEDIVKPILFTRPNVKISALFRQFQKKKQHLAIVHDPHLNINVGVVTLEDVIEELVGEIDDEYDAEDEEKALILKNLSKNDND